VVGGVPCAAARTERRKALFSFDHKEKPSLFIFCRELPDIKEGKKTQEFLKNF
jgi:hypothetical protein